MNFLGRSLLFLVFLLISSVTVFSSFDDAYADCSQVGMGGYYSKDTLKFNKQSYNKSDSPSIDGKVKNCNVDSVKVIVKDSCGKTVATATGKVPFSNGSEPDYFHVQVPANAWYFSGTYTATSSANGNSLSSTSMSFNGPGPKVTSSSDPVCSKPIPKSVGGHTLSQMTPQYKGGLVEFSKTGSYNGYSFDTVGQFTYKLDSNNKITGGTGEAIVKMYTGTTNTGGPQSCSKSGTDKINFRVTGELRNGKLTFSPTSSFPSFVSVSLKCANVSSWDGGSSTPVSHPLNSLKLSVPHSTSTNYSSGWKVDITTKADSSSSSSSSSSSGSSSSSPSFGSSGSLKSLGDYSFNLNIKDTFRSVKQGEEVFVLFDTSALGDPPYMKFSHTKWSMHGITTSHAKGVDLWSGGSMGFMATIKTSCDTKPGNYPITITASSTTDTKSTPDRVTLLVEENSKCGTSKEKQEFLKKYFENLDKKSDSKEKPITPFIKTDKSNYASDDVIKVTGNVGKLGIGKAFSIGFIPPNVEYGVSTPGMMSNSDGSFSYNFDLNHPVSQTLWKSGTYIVSFTNGNMKLMETIYIQFPLSSDKKSIPSKSKIIEVPDDLRDAPNSLLVSDYKWDSSLDAVLFDGNGDGVTISKGLEFKEGTQLSTSNAIVEIEKENFKLTVSPFTKIKLLANNTLDLIEGKIKILEKKLDSKIKSQQAKKISVKAGGSCCSATRGTEFTVEHIPSTKTTIWNIYDGVVGIPDPSTGKIVDFTKNKSIIATDSGLTSSYLSQSQRDIVDVDFNFSQFENREILSKRSGEFIAETLGVNGAPVYDGTYLSGQDVTVFGNVGKSFKSNDAVTIKFKEWSGLFPQEITRDVSVNDDGSFQLTIPGNEIRGEHHTVCFYYNGLEKCLKLEFLSLDDFIYESERELKYEKNYELSLKYAIHLLKFDPNNQDGKNLKEQSLIKLGKISEPESVKPEIEIPDLVEKSQPITKLKVISELESVKPNRIEKSQSITTQKEKVPSWIKNNAKWWTSGQINENDFVKGIEHLIKENVISVPKQTTAASSNQGIPDWVKTQTEWWANGVISEDEYLSSIEYLVKQGIVNIGSDESQSVQNTSSNIVEVPINPTGFSITFETGDAELLDDVSMTKECVCLVFSVDSPHDESIKVTIPRNLFDAKQNSLDDSFFVLVDGNETYIFEFEKTSSNRIISIPVESGVSEVEIIGTHILNEIPTESQTSQPQTDEASSQITSPELEKLISQGIDAYYNQNFDKSIEIADKIAGIDNTNYSYFWILGWSASGLEHHLGSIEIFDDGLKIYPDDCDYMQGKAFGLYYIDDMTQAKQYANKVIQNCSNLDLDISNMYIIRDS